MSATDCAGNLMPKYIAYKAFNHLLLTSLSKVNILFGNEGEKLHYASHWTDRAGGIGWLIAESYQKHNDLEGDSSAREPGSNSQG